MMDVSGSRIVFLVSCFLTVVVEVRSVPAVLNKTESDCILRSLQCVDVTGFPRCLNPSEICNGQVDCIGGRDENSCGEHDFSSVDTDSGRSVPFSRVTLRNVALKACAKLCADESGFECSRFHYSRSTSECRLVTNRQITQQSQFDDNTESDWISYTILNEKRVKRQTRFSFPDNFGRTFARSANSACGSRTVDFEPPRGRGGRIINGVTPPYGSYPWLVMIQKLDPLSMDFKQHCGGSIISEKLILTAAHCLAGLRPRDVKVVVGQHDINARDPAEEVFEVDKFAMHQEYSLNHRRNHDIAIIRIRLKNGAAIQYGPYVQPICLASSMSLYQPGLWCTVAGWGLQKAGDKSSTSNVQKAVAVPIISSDTCTQKDVYGSYPSNEILTDGMVCAGFLEGGIDACGGDSGGPLACQIDGKFQLLGVVSWGEDCAKKNKPGVYAKVGYYARWIEETSQKL